VDREHAELGLNQGGASLAPGARIVAASVSVWACGGRRGAGGLGQRLEHRGFVVGLESGAVGRAGHEPQHRSDDRDGDRLDLVVGRRGQRALRERAVAVVEPHRVGHDDMAMRVELE
jgi:hypothetical protein